MPKLFRGSRMTMALALSAILACLFPGTARAQGFKYWDAADTSKAPSTLSATGLYVDIAGAKKKLVPNAYHFDVNSALWSDGAKKSRWVLIKPGASIGFIKDGDYWKYPDSTVFIKLFAIDTIPGDTTSRINWETRLLINKKELADSGLATQRMEDVWHGFSYKWNPDQKDAVLVSFKYGRNDTLRVYPNGVHQAFVMKKWRFPSLYDCERCHRVGYADTLHGRSVLGFFTAQLNRPHPDSANINQLEYFFRKGVLKGDKPASWNDFDVPRWAGIDDNTASIDLRARSYIAANCSGCHGHRGMETGAVQGVSLNYDYFNMKEQMEFRYRFTGPHGLDDDSVTPKYYPTTDYGNNPGGLDSLVIQPALVVPGYPQKSVVLFRQTSRNTAPLDWDPTREQMPPLASFEVNVPATTLIAKWIKEWTPFPASIPIGIRTSYARTLLKGPAIQGNQLILPMDLAGSGSAEPKVSLTGIDGRSHELTRLSRTAYALPRLSPGLYIIKVDGRSFARHLF